MLIGWNENMLSGLPHKMSNGLKQKQKTFPSLRKNR